MDKIMESQNQAFNNILAYFPEEMAQLLRALSDHEKAQIQEIRLRTGRPLVLFDGWRSLFLSPHGGLWDRPGGMQINRDLLHKCFIRLCDYSVHTHEQELCHGFITTPKGDRVGVCASAVLDREGLVAYREVSSLNIRISREICGAGTALMSQVDILEGGIIAGPPGAGKTTVLRDICRTLSTGERGACRKVTVIDERYEITAMHQGQPRRDIGFCDAICGQSKALAIRQAVRTLSPQIIACDEIDSLEEVGEIAAGLCCGVNFLVTVHCGTPDELRQSPIIQRLMATGAFGWAALLAGPQYPAKIIDVATREEYKNAQNDRNFNYIRCMRRLGFSTSR